MLRLEQDNRTTIFEILFRKAIVDDVYPDDDTLDIEIVDHEDERTGEKTALYLFSIIASLTWKSDKTGRLWAAQMLL